MALSAAPFALKNLGLDSEQLRQAVASLVPNSGGIVQTGDFTVTQTTTPSLGVSVGLGRAWVPGTNVTNLAGQSYSTQAQYFILNDGAVTVNLSTADSSNPRIDLVYLGMQDKFYGGAADQPVLGVVKGVAATTPVAPTLSGASIANAIPLANVAVAANATSILNANITNIAVGFTKPFGHMGRTGGTQNINGSYIPVVMTAAQILRGGMTFDSTNSGRLTIPITGYYIVRLKAYMTGAALQRYSVAAYVNQAERNTVSLAYWKQDGNDYTDFTTGVVLLNAGDKVGLGYTVASGATAGTDGYGGTWIEIEYLGPA